MKNSSTGRFLPIIIAAAAFCTGITVLLVLLVNRPDSAKFRESLDRAYIFLELENDTEIRRNLIRASRFAVYKKDWYTLLELAVATLPDNAGTDDYRVVNILSGRASARFPDTQIFEALKAWSLLRSGRVRAAERASVNLESDRWSSLRFEVRLANQGNKAKSKLESLTDLFREEGDPDFLRQAAELTESAELAFDAALVFRNQNQFDQAYELARDIMNGQYQWINPENQGLYIVPRLLSRIAVDVNQIDRALIWMQSRVESWKDMQVIGDLYLERFVRDGRTEDRDSALYWWKESRIVIGELSSVPPDSWKIWINEASILYSMGRIEESRELLEDSLILFPDNSEAKVAWAMNMRFTAPSLSGRLINRALEESEDPFLEIAKLVLNPDSVDPGEYDSLLWKNFGDVIDNRVQGNRTVRKSVVSCLLAYLTDQYSYSAVDTAVERYLSAYSQENWILSWQLAADAVRGVAGIDLIPQFPQSPPGRSPRERFRSYARQTRDWKALHDSALFTIMAAAELEDSFDSIDVTGVISRTGSESVLDAFVLEHLKKKQNNFQNSPLRKRIDRLLNDYSVGIIPKTRARLFSGGNNTKIPEMMMSVLQREIRTLYEESLDDLFLATESSVPISGDGLSDIYFAEALVYERLGNIDLAVSRVRESILENPENISSVNLLERLLAL